MAYRILSAAAFACLAIAGPALAGSVTECHGGWYGSGHGGWGPKRYVYECQATSESRYGTTQTTCNSRFGCVTTSERKPQPEPIIQDPRSTRTMMDGPLTPAEEECFAAYQTGARAPGCVYVTQGGKLTEIQIFPPRRAK